MCSDVLTVAAGKEMQTQAPIGNFFVDVLKIKLLRNIKHVEFNTKHPKKVLKVTKNLDGCLKKNPLQFFKKVK